MGPGPPTFLLSSPEKQASVAHHIEYCGNIQIGFQAFLDAGRRHPSSFREAKNDSRYALVFPSGDAPGLLASPRLFLHRARGCRLEHRAHLFHVDGDRLPDASGLAKSPLLVEFLIQSYRFELGRPGK